MKNKYEIRGDTTVIFLRRKNGIVLEALIDTDDFNIANSFKGTWYASNDEYVRGWIMNGKKNIHLHREILIPAENKQVDHINHNKLDNRKINLRIVTNSQNRQNLLPQNNSKTRIRGVTWCSRDKIYLARIRVNNKLIYQKYFKNIEDAAREISNARKKYMPFAIN